MSIPITRLIRFPPVLGQGSGGLHDNYGSALAAQSGGSQGRPATNTSSQLIVRIGLPTLHAPSAPQPGWSHHTRRSSDHRRVWDTASIMPVTNLLERPNEEIKRRTHVVRIFPNAESCLRLVRALAVEMHENWLEAHRYLNMDDLREPKKEALRMAA